MRCVSGYIKLFLLITYYNIKSRSIYRANFLLSIVQSIITAIVFISTVWIMLNWFKDINGWNLYEIGFMLGIAKLSQSLTVMFFSTLWFMDVMVNRGELDKILVRPRSPLFQLVFQRIEIKGIGEVFTSLVIVIYFILHSGIEWNCINVFYILMFILLSWFVFFCIIFLSGLFSFWFLKTNSIRDFTNTVYSCIIPYPLFMYGNKIQYFFTLVIPIGFIYYYPSLYLFGKSDLLFKNYISWLSPVVAVAMALVCWAVWKLGLRNYGSCGN